jgi:SNF2 family DNA or RNA helicase
MTDYADFPFRVVPYDYQLKLVEETCEQQYWAYFLEMGLGKSKIVIDNFSWLYLNKKIDTVIIIGNKGEYANWEYEHIPEHLPDALFDETMVFRHSSLTHAKSSRLKALGALMAHEGLKIFIINIEALNTDAGARALAMLGKASRLGWYFVIDESTSVKSFQAKRSKEAYFWAARSKYRRIMTGTPITQSPMDLWGQCLVLGKGVLGHSSYFSFRGEYSVIEPMFLGNRVIKQVVGYKNLPKLNKVLQSFSSQLLKKDCLDLPPKIYEKKYVELTTEQARMYNTLRDEAILELEDGRDITVTNILALLTKLHQISCGQLKVEENDYVSIENNRLPLLLELLEDYPGKAIIWCSYRQTLEDVYEALALAHGANVVATYYGGTPERDRPGVISRFQDMGSPLRFIVANPQSMGRGHNLVQAQLVIYYSNSYNLEDRLQSEDRTHRIGQTGAVNYIDLVTKGTVDEKIIKALREKRNLAAEVLGVEDWKAWL